MTIHHNHIIITVDSKLKDTLVDDIRKFLVDRQVEILSENVFDRNVAAFKKHKSDIATFFCAKVLCEANILKTACIDMRKNMTGILLTNVFRLTDKEVETIPNEVIE